MTSGGQITVDLAGAPARVAELLSRAGGVGPRRVSIGVTGPVGSGKSTLASRLAGPGDLILSTDHYLPDYEHVPFEERDEPRHADLELLASHLAALRGGRAATVPRWSFLTHRRESHEAVGPVGPDALIIVEGIHALHEPVRNHLDLAVFVEAPGPVRWARWENLERTGQRGWGVEHAREFFERVAEPAFARHAAAYRAAADVVVENP